MKSRMMKKVFAAAMSTTLVMGLSMTAFASGAGSDPSATVDAPIYSFDVIDVVVPATLVVAFNPDELTVQTGASASDTETSQVLSHNFGILNKSSKDKVVTVTLTVADKNVDSENNPMISFVDSATAASGAEAGEYAVYLAAVPADATEVKVGTTPASADKDTAATALANVTMTAASNQVALAAGENKIAFVLDKAVYSPKSTGGIVLGTTNGNDVTSNYEITAVAAAGKGISAFSFTGALNKNTDWTKLQQGIEIKAVYTFANANGETPVTGTGAMLNPDAAPSIKTTDFAILEAGTDAQIQVDLGVGDLKATEVVSISWNGTNFLGNGYTYADGVVTVPAGSVDYFLTTPTKSCELVIKFDDDAGTEKTVTLTAKP